MWYFCLCLANTCILKFFVIGHDCAHKAFSRNKLVEDIVGTLAFLPLIYPYEPWRFKHDRHHAKTNMLVPYYTFHFSFLIFAFLILDSLETEHLQELYSSSLSIHNRFSNNIIEYGKYTCAQLRNSKRR